MGQQPGEHAGGEEEGAERRRWSGPFHSGARNDRGRGHTDVTVRIPPPCPPPQAGRLARRDQQYHLGVVETIAQAALQQTGVRLTPQRLAIAAVLAQTGKETSAQELYERVRKKHAYIGRATVFRSLETLVSAGLAQRLERPGHISAYVWCEPGHHHHLICTTCRTVEDLDEEAVAPLAETIARQRGFRVDHATLDFYGECRSCSSRARSSLPRLRRRVRLGAANRART
ncbi:MAG: transcriptional repressor [Chloroflexi bacterium]|nr:MAG: transcriptional repressor [Chloroflexota bacterium]